MVSPFPLPSADQFLCCPRQGQLSLSVLFLLLSHSTPPHSSLPCLCCRLAQLPSGEDGLLATPGGHYPGPDRREASGRRHEMGAEDQITPPSHHLIASLPQLPLTEAICQTPASSRWSLQVERTPPGLGLGTSSPPTPPCDTILEPLIFFISFFSFFLPWPLPSHLSCSVCQA